MVSLLCTHNWLFTGLWKWKSIIVMEIVMEILVMEEYFSIVYTHPNTVRLYIAYTDLYKCMNICISLCMRCHEKFSEIVMEEIRVYFWPQASHWRWKLELITCQKRIIIPESKSLTKTHCSLLSLFSVTNPLRHCCLSQLSLTHCTLLSLFSAIFL